MERNLLVLLFYFIGTTLFGQSGQIKFGEVTYEEVAMQTYDKDSTAEAVVLYDYCNVYFKYTNGEYIIVKEVHQRIKLLSDNRKEYNEVKIKLKKGEFIFSNEDMKNSRSYLYTLSGEKIQEKELSIERDNFMNRMVESTINYTINLAKYKKGSIVEITYTTETPFSVSKIPMKWYFQHTVPMVKSEYRITIPEWFYYKLMITNDPTFTVDEKYTTDLKLQDFKIKGSVYHLVSENIPAFKTEPNMPPFKAYLPSLSFDYLDEKSIYDGFIKVSPSFVEFETWDAIDAYFLKLDRFGGQLTLPHLFEEEVALFSQISDIQKRAEAIYDYIKTTYKFNSRLHEIDGDFIQISDLNRLKATKYGNAASINLLLLNLLKASGIEAYPILLGTRDSGQISVQAPTLANLNYLLIGIRINDKLIYADASNEKLPLGMIPEKCLNVLGRLIDTTDAPRFVYLENENRNTTVVNIEAELNRNSIKGHCEMKEKGYKALEIQNEISEKCQDTTFINSYKSKYRGWDSSNFEIENRNFPDISTTLRYDFSKKMSDSNDTLVIPPIFFSQLTETPFPANERKYPIDLKTKMSFNYFVKLNISEDVSILTVPSPESLILPNNGGRLNYTISHNEAENTLTVAFSSALLKSIYSAEEYHFLKEFYDKIIEIQAKPIVLKIN